MKKATPPVGADNLRGAPRGRGFSPAVRGTRGGRGNHRFCESECVCQRGRGDLMGVVEVWRGKCS